MNNIPRNEHPRPDRHRDSWLSLNGTWDFEIDNALVGEGKKFFERTSLDGKITVPFCPESELSGVGNKDFMYGVWYKRTITVIEEQLTGLVRLHFGAVDYACKVWVNGELCGIHKGGYTAFEMDITKLSHIYIQSPGSL